MSRPVLWIVAIGLSIAVAIAVGNPDARANFFQTLPSNGGGTALVILAGALAGGSLWRKRSQWVRTPEMLRIETAATLKWLFRYAIVVLLVVFTLIAVRAFKEPTRDTSPAVSSVVNDPPHVQAPVPSLSECQQDATCARDYATVVSANRTAGAVCRHNLVTGNIDPRDTSPGCENAFATLDQAESAIFPRLSRDDALALRERLLATR